MRRRFDGRGHPCVLFHPGEIECFSALELIIRITGEGLRGVVGRKDLLPGDEPEEWRSVDVFVTPVRE